MLFEQQTWPPSRRTAALTAGLPASGRRGQGNAGDDGGGQIGGGGGQFVDGLAAAGEEAGFLKEVRGGITADGEF